MRILLCPYNYYPSQHAGGEGYLHLIAKNLIQSGHEVKAIVQCHSSYTFEGVECHPMGKMETIWTSNNELCEWADVIIMQLLGNSYGYNKAKQHNKKLIFIVHNTSKHYFVYRDTGIIYNSQTLANLTLYPKNPSFILPPLVSPAKLTNGSKIALVNCNLNKGGKEFIELAKMLPQYQFVGIKGMYGDQITAELPNLQYRENTLDVDYSDVKLLLVPSETESWSMAATEAIMRGIPVLCSDLPGVRENLSYAGIYIDRKDLYSYKNAIIELMNNGKSYHFASARCLERAKELDPVQRFKEFEKWLIEFVR